MSMSMMQSVWFYVAVLGVLCLLTALPMVAIRLMAMREERTAVPVVRDRTAG